MAKNNDGHIDIKKFYKDSAKSDTRTTAFQFFSDKYFKQPFDNYWIIEEESRFEARKLKFFLPGSIYLFQYPKPITKDYLSYFDKRPMVLILGTFIAKTTGRTIVQGINLDFIPEKQKVELLDTYYKVFMKDLLGAEKDSDKGLVGQAKNLAKYLKDWALLTKVFVDQGKIPLTFTIRNYDMKGMLNPVLVEIEDWPMIPFYVPREFEGKGPAQVYADYITAKKQEIAKRTPVDSKANQANKKRFK
jgi:hypothetical protein